MNAKLDKLRELVADRIVLRDGPYTLASGNVSEYYYDLKLATYDPEAIALIGELVLDRIKGTGAEAIGGLETGANPIITATLIAANQAKVPLKGFYVRKEVKRHGTKNAIEGYLPSGERPRVALVEDVITQGGSISQAITEVENAGFEVAKIVAVVDRLEGGSQKVRGRGYEVDALFEATNGVVRTARFEKSAA